MCINKIHDNISSLGQKIGASQVLIFCLYNYNKNCVLTSLCIFTITINILFHVGNSSRLISYSSAEHNCQPRLITHSTYDKYQHNYAFAFKLYFILETFIFSYSNQRFCSIWFGLKHLGKVCMMQVNDQTVPWITKLSLGMCDSKPLLAKNK